MPLLPITIGDITFTFDFNSAHGYDEYSQTQYDEIVSALNSLANTAPAFFSYAASQTIVFMNDYQPGTNPQNPEIGAGPAGMDIYPSGTPSIFYFAAPTLDEVIFGGLDAISAINTLGNKLTFGLDRVLYHELAHFKYGTSDIEEAAGDFASYLAVLKGQSGTDATITEVAGETVFYENLLFGGTPETQRAAYIGYIGFDWEFEPYLARPRMAPVQRTSGVYQQSRSRRCSMGSGEYGVGFDGY